jgi:GntR family transcriptional regulator
MSDQIFFSSTDNTPMYSQIMEHVMAKVLIGDWRPGQALPSIRELASASRVSVITVKRAYLELERTGVIVTRHGIGSFVADTQDLPRQLAQEEFDTHLLGMLRAASKLGMPAAAVVEVVHNSLTAELTAAVPEKQATKRK